jgi:hypothetical protein
MRCTSHLVHDKAFSYKTWTCDRLPQTALFADKTNSMSTCAKTFRKTVTDFHGYRKCLNSLRGRRLDDITTIQDKSLAAPNKFKTPYFCKSLNSIHQVARGLLQREQHWIEGKCSYHREKKNSPFIIWPHHTHEHTEPYKFLLFPFTPYIEFSILIFHHWHLHTWNEDWSEGWWAYMRGLYWYYKRGKEAHFQCNDTYLHLLKRCSNRQTVPGNKTIQSIVHAYVNWQPVLCTCQG